MWTKFQDNESGGERKLEWDTIFIELPEEEAIVYFEKRFDMNPFETTCQCCGEDFHVSTASPTKADYLRNKNLIINESKLNNDSF